MAHKTPANLFFFLTKPKDFFFSSCANSHSPWSQLCLSVCLFVHSLPQFFFTKEDGTTGVPTHRDTNRPDDRPTGRPTRLTNRPTNRPADQPGRPNRQICGPIRRASKQAPPRRPSGELLAVAYPLPFPRVPSGHLSAVSIH